MKIIFMGTPEFAVPVLESLIRSRHEVVAVYTKPDEAAGRGKKIVFPPVKEKALEYGIEVRQPESLKPREVRETLFSTDADVIVVAAYGKILRKSVLECKKYGCINVHASLLPKYRGAAPVQHAVLDGEKTSGVTIMQMDEGLDTGDMLKKKEVALSRRETTGTLLEKLASVGGPLLLEVLDEIENGSVQREVQTETTTEYASMIEKSMGEIDFRSDAEKEERRIRAMDPWPSAYAHRNGALLKLWSADVILEAALTEEEKRTSPGTVIRTNKTGFSIRFGVGALTVLELQPEGKKRMTASEYVRGYRIQDGEMLKGRDGD